MICHFNGLRTSFQTMYRKVKSIEIWPRNQAKTVRKLVRSIFQAALGELEFLQICDSYECNFLRVHRWMSKLVNIQSTNPNSHKCGRDSLGKSVKIYPEDSVCIGSVRLTD